jgi:hypothetical protein
MKLDQLFAKIKPMQKFINTMDLNQQGYYYLEEGCSTVRYVAYEGCPASTIPLNVNMLFSEAWEIKDEYQRKVYMVKQIECRNNELIDVKIKAVFDTMDNARNYLDKCQAEDPYSRDCGIFYKIEDFEVQ